MAAVRYIVLKKAGSELRDYNKAIQDGSSTISYDSNDASRSVEAVMKRLG